MRNIIEVENLIKNYKNVEAVKGITFEVEEGAFFALLGINGAGKSTTINILCTVLEKTAGKVIIDGHNLEQDPNKIKDLIGIVFQGHVLDDILTVKENLESRVSYYGLDRHTRNQRINDIVRMLELENILNQKYGTLSGGQRRRVDIARALVNRPKILFLDEPTTGLDPQTRVMVWEIIHKLRKDNKLTVFLTTHYMEETVDCDKVIILDSGKIVANDTPHNLKNKYAQNKIVWYTEQNENNNKLLLEEQLTFEYNGSAYKINVKNSSEATTLLTKYQAFITDYEVIKGDMDDVFLTVTGKKLGD